MVGADPLGPTAVSTAAPNNAALESTTMAPNHTAASACGGRTRFTYKSTRTLPMWLGIGTLQPIEALRSS